MARTKIDLITGILGSGKTTFLRHYAQHFLSRGQRIAILENDFGAVNADMVMLQDLKSDRCALEMITGGGDPDCHKRRFKTQLISLSMRHFDRVIMEPSGIFDMDEFFDTLHESPLDCWYEIGSVLTVLDAGMPEMLSAQAEYLLASEAACSGLLLLSKLSFLQGESPEQAGIRVLAHVNRALTAISCDRQFTDNDLLIRDWDALNDSDFQRCEHAGFRSAGYVKHYSTEDIQSGVHYFMHLALPREQIAAVIAEIFGDPACGEIFRIKGSLPDGQGGWLRINAARERTEILPVGNGQAVLIAIGDHICREAIDRHLSAYNTDPDYVSI
ncbi:MAG: GTPase (G3E family) [Oscillospiraceae bacterium]|nr:GTPase (G3E family) [Oscillospiraceae bacterium]